MKRSRFGFALSVVALVALGLGGGAAYVSAADDDSAVVEGELVDMKCYVAMGMPGGGKHNKCAMDCAKMGIPAGVIDSRTGQVFTVLAPTPARTCPVHGQDDTHHRQSRSQEHRQSFPTSWKSVKMASRRQASCPKA